ncbi:MAG: sigma-70 family RNA polymerase sigma factor [Planctomycetota bacterium]
MTDAELVACAQQGSDNAFEELVRRHEGNVYRVAKRILPNYEDARDVAQETFLRTFRSLDRLDPTRPIEHWLLAVTVNLCRSTLRKRRPSLELVHVEEPAAPADADAPALAALNEALVALPPKYRIPIVLFHQEGKSCEEVAALLGASSNRVRTWLHRGRRMLRDAMLRKGFSPGGRS